MGSEEKEATKKERRRIQYTTEKRDFVIPSSVDYVITICFFSFRVKNYEDREHILLIFVFPKSNIKCSAQEFVEGINESLCPLWHWER